MFHTETADKTKIQILSSKLCFRKSGRLKDNVEIRGTAGQATDDNIVQRMRFACCITKATDTHSEYVTLLFHGNNGHANAPQCYVIRT